MIDSRRTIIFVTPPYHCGVVEVAGTWPPLGFVSLGAQAEAAGWRAEIYDAMSLRHGHREIAEHLRGRRCDVVAVTAITPTYPDAVEVCRTAKAVHPGCVTLMGGVHPTFMAEDILDREPAVDYILAGEGEPALRAFLEAFEDTEARRRSPNLVWRGEFGPVRNPRLPLVEDLDSLPGAWHLLPWELYTYFVIPGSRLGAVSTSRGCSFGCTFCSQQKFWDRSWRGRSPAAVVAEMQHLRDEYGVDVVLFTDEYPTRDPERWEALLDALIAARWDGAILMETRVEDIVRDEAILPKYRQAGVVHIYVGAEATDQDVLDGINKELAVEDSRRALRLIAAHDMISETSFVLGFPDETPESIARTLKLARQFDPDFAHFLAITPWPYTDLHREYAEFIEEHDLRKYNLIEPVIRPRAMTRRQIDQAIIECYARFYMPKMKDYMQVKSGFRRGYLLKSARLIMQSSFLVEKFARLGLDPRKIMRKMLGTQKTGKVGVDP